ncbi:MAG: hypothetical protein EP333_00135 [Bacteroidetes bacterium]|nr:MAG: hypothetical protein EP333_00135 [Bacteroidota bacterium]
MKKKYLLAFSVSAYLLIACGSGKMIVNDSEQVDPPSTNSTSSNEESDTVLIGDQVWMSHNLNTLVFKNGDTILQARTNEEWVNAAKNKIPAWCYANNEESNGETYGRLYNYWAVIDSRGLAPEGWRIPSDEDFAALLLFVNSNGEVLKSTTAWEKEGNGNNNSGFNAFPGGYRNATGLFNPIGRLTAWWTLTEKSSGSAFGYTLIAADQSFKKDEYYKRSGLSVRCVR